MDEILDIISSVTSLSQMIHTQYKQIKANKHQSRRLYERIKIVIKPLKVLNKGSNNSLNIKPALLRLQTCLKACLALMKEFDEKHWAKKVLFAGTYSDRFAELNKDLFDSANLLQLGIDVELLTNQEQNAKDQVADHAHILENQDLIITLVQRNQKELRGLKLSQRQNHHVLRDQLASLKEQLKQLSEATNQKARMPVDARLQIPHFDLLFKEILAEGEFGIVYAGLWKEDSVAIKFFKKLDEDSRKAFNLEVEIMGRLRSPYVVQFLGACLEKGRECLVMEYMSQGSLHHLLHTKRKIFTQKEKIHIALSVTKGLKHLHAGKMLHRDLRTGNVLINANKQVKLADFRTTQIKTRSILSIYGEQTETSNALICMPPEFIAKMEYTEASDIFSLGVLLWELFTEQLVAKETEFDSASNPFQFPETIEAPIKQLIQRCLSEEPDERLGLSEIIRQFTKLTPKNKSKKRGSTSSSPQTSSSAMDPKILCRQGLEHERQENFEEAYECYHQAAKQNDPRGLCNLGMLILQNKGKPEDTSERAVELLKRSADF